MQEPTEMFSFCMHFAELSINLSLHPAIPKLINLYKKDQIILKSCFDELFISSHKQKHLLANQITAIIVSCSSDF